jgi:predicted SprT family Zn-dependent metalloprotease
MSKLFSKKIKNWLREYDEKIQLEITSLLLNYDKRIKPSTVRGYVVKAIRGRAHTEYGQFTVPEWTFIREEGYFTYYVAHELSHVIAWRRYKNRVHDENFYKIFCKLCPENLQHFEINYKKRSLQYGVKQKN